MQGNEGCFPILTASFSSDTVGQRIQQTLNSTTTNFLYDGLNLVQELTGTTPTANLLTGLGIDETFLRTDAAGTQTLLTDGLGSTMALADSSGTLVTQYTYDPFGKTTFTGTASTNAAKYTGREDDGTGLYYYRARYYHPILQRFMSEDPIGFVGGDVNLHAYVFNNPISATDPSGQIGLVDGAIGGVLGGVGGGLGAYLGGADAGGILAGAAAGAAGGIAGGLVSGVGPSAALGGFMGALGAAATGGNAGAIAGAALGGAWGGALSGLAGGGLSGWAAGTWRGAIDGSMLGILGSEIQKQWFPSQSYPQ